LKYISEVYDMAPKKGQITTGKVFMWGIGLMFVALLIFGGPLQWAYEQYAPDWAREKPGEIPEDSALVDLSVRLQYALGRDVPGTAIPIDVYDANMVPIETQNTDTTTGVATFQADYWEGETIFLQPYTAPSSTTGLLYASDAIQYTVPEGDVNGDAQLPQIEIRELTSSEATFTAADSGGTAVSGTATNYLNGSSDSVLRLTIVCTSTDSNFGMPTTMHDERTGFDYLAGGWIVLRTNESQDLQGVAYSITTPSYYYYVFSFAMIVNDADDYSDGVLVFTVSATSTFSAGSGDCSLTIDIYDCMRLTGSGGIDTNSWKDYDTDLTPNVITTAINA
jgi:hypothetical protein